MSLILHRSPNKDQISYYDHLISVCNTQILLLTKQIKDLKRKKVGLENSTSPSSKENVDREANIGLQHVETTDRLDSEFELLKTEESKC